MTHKHDLWFEQISGPLAGGKVTRHYRITCHRCGSTASHHASALYDDRLRKHFIRDGWDIGRTSSQHTCPGCLAKRNKPKSIQAVRLNLETPPPVQRPSLADAWHAASDDERRALIASLSTPVDAAPAAEPAPTPEPELVDDDGGQDEPAEWWNDLQKKYDPEKTTQ